MNNEDKELEAAKDLAKAIHEDKSAEINGREYRITKMNHAKRRKVFAYFSHVQSDLSRGDFWFLETKEWAEVEKTINNVVTFEDCLLSKLPQHWDDYPQDYMLFIQSMLAGISYPFLDVNLGG